MTKYTITSFNKDRIEVNLQFIQNKKKHRVQFRQLKQLLKLYSVPNYFPVTDSHYDILKLYFFIAGLSIIYPENFHKYPQ